MRVCGFFFFILLLCPLVGRGTNIRIDSVRYTATDVNTGQPRLTMSFTVVWENSWRDDYNYDAAYVFFKFKKIEKADAKQPEEWHHLFLAAEGNEIGAAFQEDYDFWLSPLSSAGTDFNTGVYIFRKDNGNWDKDSVSMQVTWNVENQMVASQLTTDDIRGGGVQIVGHAIEMVYIPRGAFRIGDGVSNKGFRKLAFPILSEYDIVSKNYKIESSNALGDTTAVYAADRINDNTGSLHSEWIGDPKASSWWWSIDFGKGVTRRITYFGVNGTKGSNNYPTRFALVGTKDPDVNNVSWDTLWTGAGKEYWMRPEDAYPVEKAIPVTKPGYYRAYKIVIPAMNTGSPVVSTVGMTETDLRSLIDYSVLIDSPVTEIDSVRKLGAADGSVWVKGQMPASFPNGYPGFYAMKYELSQDQYVRFLNKLTYTQQNGLLENRLDDLEEGDYIFGATGKADYRNGIVLTTKIAGMPAVFACDLDGDGVGNRKNDGGNVACNYMNIQDMLAYADWACLRPLSEMEYEKMSRAFYPAVPVKKSFAWGTTKLEAPAEVSGLNTEAERAGSGNANWGNTLGYPLRVGAFAPLSSPGLERSGAGFWGCMDLCGNLAELYYNANLRGIELVTETGDGNLAAGHDSSHGDGQLDSDGRYNGVKAKRWSDDPEAFAVRGGSFAADTSFLQVSDRTWHAGYFKNILQRDSTVTFRLGRTAPTYPELESWLITENEETTQGTGRSDLFVRSTTYMIKGNKPENPRGGVMNYIWYSSESGGEWKVMENRVNRDLYFDKYRNDTIIANINGLNLSFKRKVFTPFTDSEASSEYLLHLIANPFDEETEVFTYNGNTYKVACNWDASVPRRWGFAAAYPGLAIDPETGVISGLDNTICNVTVTLMCTLNEAVVYRKKVKETVRTFAYRGSVKEVNILPGTYTVDCYGGQGGSMQAGWTGIGGKGGRTAGTLIVESARAFYIYVGGQGQGYNGSANHAGGWNGGGNCYGGASGGGGATDIRINGGNWNDATSLRSRIMVAAGGGGSNDNQGGGAGGGLTGGTGIYASGSPGTGGTQTAGGTGWLSGSFGIGAGYVNNYADGGAGGGGYYGGGKANGNAAAGGGGSSFISGYPGCNAVTAAGVHTGKPEHYSGLVFKDATMSSGVRAGHGVAYITVK